jgi:RNA polymerase sigma factor (sigma-70 family)
MKGKNKDRRSGDHYVDHYSSHLSYDRRKGGRIRYLNWAIELYGCFDDEIQKRILHNSSGSKQDDSINREVRKAIAKLLPEERQFVQLFYFEFKSYREISRKLKRKIHKLERIHQRALDKLRILLTDFVEARFGLKIPQKVDCIICKSPFRRELDELIRNKREDETYSRLISIFKQKYGIKIKTPQVIIGHKKKHMV